MHVITNKVVTFWLISSSDIEAIMYLKILKECNILKNGFETLTIVSNQFVGELGKATFYVHT